MNRHSLPLSSMHYRRFQFGVLVTVWLKLSHKPYKAGVDWVGDSIIKANLLIQLTIYDVESVSAFTDGIEQ